MNCHRISTNAYRAALAATVFASLFAVAPAFAGNPCKSEDPLDFDDALRRADCGDAADMRAMERTRAGADKQDSTSAGDNQQADYSYLPTTVSAWYDSLSQADQSKFAARLVQEANVGGRNLSRQEINALLTLTFGELDSYFAEQELTADQRRRAIAEIAVESGVGLAGEEKRGLNPDDAIFGADRRRFGDVDDADYSSYKSYTDQGWKRVDPTDPNGEFGQGDADPLSSDPDLDDF